MTPIQFLREAVSAAISFSIGCMGCWAANNYVLLPSEIDLYGVHAEQHLLIEKTDGNEYFGSLNGATEITSTDADVCLVEDNRVLPVANGRTTLVAVVDGKQIEADVRVSGMEDATLRSFRNDVLPVLSKVGCNQGACHGTLAGKGGFKLSLRGYNPLADFVKIAHEARGRRIELMDPGRSLLLAKPSGALPHKGGIRFEVDSVNYRILADWISQGAIPPVESDRRVVSLEILPAHVLLPSKGVQRFVVQAKYSDGQLRDVTRWTKFESVNESVARVTEDGLLQVTGSGEGAMTAWFDSKIAIASVTVPYANDVSEYDYSSRERNSFIDTLVLGQLSRLHLAASPPVDDATFIRRVYIDTIGTLPTADAVTTFLDDESPAKRDRLIDSLLERSEFVDYWAYKWSDVLLVNGLLLRPNAVKAYYQWIRQKVEENTPWDEFARQLLTAQGHSFKNGATNFFAIHQDPESMVENACQAFLGLSIGCAKCHNHPLEKWTNDQYYAMANFFARVRGKGWGGDLRAGGGERTVYAATSGDLIQPSSGRPQPPTPLDSHPIDIDWPGDRRIIFAEWITAPENPYFARAFTNRVWANFLGVGLVEQVDDMRISNPASNEALLSAAAEFLVDSGFDLQVLMKEILRSKTYQSSSQPLAGNEDECRFYSRYYPRRLNSEVLLDAISQVTGIPNKFIEIGTPGSDKESTDFYPEGTRALQLYDSAVVSGFLSSFGRNPRTITCECERSNTPSIVQVLHLSNGETINEKLRQDGNSVTALLERGLSDSELLDQAFLMSLARYPTVSERLQFVPMLRNLPRRERREVVEDLFWGIFSSTEFLFNH